MTAGKKSLFLNLALGVALLLIVIFILLTRDKPQPVLTLYDGSMGDDITQIVIKISGESDIHLVNRPATADLTGEPSTSWQMTQPRQAAVDKARVQHLFTLLTDPVTKTYPAAAQPLARFGLDAPLVRVSFNGVELGLGDYNDVSQTRYVLKGDTIYLIAETVYSLLKSGVDGFIPQSKASEVPLEKAIYESDDAVVDTETRNKAAIPDGEPAESPDMPAAN